MTISVIQLSFSVAFDFLSASFDVVRDMHLGSNQTNA